MSHCAVPFPTTPHEYKVTSLRPCPTPESLQLCDTSDKAAGYWRLHIATERHFNPDSECMAVLLLNTRRRVKGHSVVATGTLDTIVTHPREIFGLAIASACSAFIVIHPSGDSTPSEADVRVTRDLIRDGQLLKLELLDHVIVGQGKVNSLREMGCFY